MPTSALGPAERVLAAYNLVALAGWLPFVRGGGTPVALVALHAAFAVTFALAGRGRPRAVRPSRTAASLALDLYPLAAIPLAWRELGVRHGYLHGTEWNALVMAADAWLCAPLLGGHANLRWAPSMPALSEAMHAAYFAFLPLFAALAIAIACTRDRARRREGVLRLALTFFTCFALYTALPTDGPLELFPRFVAGVDGGSFYRLNHGLRAAGDSLGTAFPSSHVAGSITLAWVAWRCLPRAVAWLYTMMAAAIGLAVVYTQNHFVADAIGGVVTALALQARVAPALLAARVRPAAAPRHDGATPAPVLAQPLGHEGAT